MTELTLPPIPKTRWQLWTERMRDAFLFGFATIALLFVITIIYKTYFNMPPVAVTVLDVAPTEPLCPGEEWGINNHIKIKQSILLYVYYSVMDKDLVHNMNDTQGRFEPRPHPVPSEFDQHLPWKVPDLPPGEYQRVITYRGYVDSETPIDVWVPFTIGENCHEGRSISRDYLGDTAGHAGISSPGEQDMGGNYLAFITSLGRSLYRALFYGSQEHETGN